MTPANKALAAEIRATMRATMQARDLRNSYFPGCDFADPTWDMLLDLFASALEGRQVSVSSLCVASGVPATTALRLIVSLHDAGVFEREDDPNDRRRAFVQLSEKGMESMRAYFATVNTNGAHLRAA